MTITSTLVTLALALPCSLHAATSIGPAVPEYHLSGTISGIEIDVPTPSGLFSVEANIWNESMPDSEPFWTFWTWIDLEPSPVGPWTSISRDIGLIADIDIAFQIDEPKSFSLLQDASGSENFYCGDYMRWYHTSFSADIDYVYDGAGNWTATGVWEYHSVLMEESGSLPVEPPSAVPEATGTLSLACLAIGGIVGALRLTRKN